MILRDIVRWLDLTASPKTRLSIARLGASLVTGMVIAGYAPEGAVSVILLMAPLTLGVVSIWPSARGHWSGPLLAAPSLLFGLAFTYALFRYGPGYGGWPLLIYSFLLLMLAMASILLWNRRRSPRNTRFGR